MKKTLTKKGLYPSSWAFLLLFPLRNIFLSPKKLITRLSLDPTMNVLEVGPGPGYFSMPLAKYLHKGELVVSDIQPEMLIKAKKRGEKQNINNIIYHKSNGQDFSDFQDQSFDRIVLITVLGEVESQESYMQEFARILKDDGILSISEQAGDPDIVSQEEIITLAQKFGFVLEHIYGTKRNYTINLKKKLG